MVGPTPMATFHKAAFFADLGYEPHPGQWPVHLSNAPRRVVACGVRWGKTRCAAMEGLAAAMAPAERSIGWIVAPTYDLADKVYREIVDVVGRHLKHRLIALKEAERRLLLRNMAGGISEIRAKSADNPVSLLGEGLDWVIVDEAARLKPSIWQGHLSQRLIDKRGWALLITTPRLLQAGQGTQGPDQPIADSAPGPDASRCRDEKVPRARPSRGRSRRRRRAAGRSRWTGYSPPGDTTTSCRRRRRASASSAPPWAPAMTVRI